MIRLFVKKLTVIDFSYLHPERGLLGESWQVDVQLTGSLDQQGMVVDFSAVKKQVKQLIDRDFDHKLIIPGNFSGSSTAGSGARIRNCFTTTSGSTIEHIAPDSAYCFLDTDSVTPEKLATSITAKLTPLLPENVEHIDLQLYPEKIDGHFYHYSHGLKHHDGNCQRIAHGHRSKIEILGNNVHEESLEKRWAEQWHDIYIGSSTDVTDQFSRDGIDYIRFSYTACQGLFELTLPAEKCYLVDTDSTVENLARHVADKLSLEYPQRQLTVFAYEGIDKGAIETTDS